MVRREAAGAAAAPTQNASAATRGSLSPSPRGGPRAVHGITDPRVSFRDPRRARREDKEALHRREGTAGSVASRPLGKQTHSCAFCVVVRRLIAHHVRLSARRLRRRAGRRRRRSQRCVLARSDWTRVGRSPLVAAARARLARSRTVNGRRPSSTRSAQREMKKKTSSLDGALCGSVCPPRVGSTGREQNDGADEARVIIARGSRRASNKNRPGIDPDDTDRSTLALF